MNSAQHAPMVLLQDALPPRGAIEVTIPWWESLCEWLLCAQGLCIAWNQVNCLQCTLLSLCWVYCCWKMSAWQVSRLKTLVFYRVDDYKRRTGSSNISSPLLRLGIMRQMWWRFCDADSSSRVARQDCSQQIAIVRQKTLRATAQWKRSEVSHIILNSKASYILVHRQVSISFRLSKLLVRWSVRSSVPPGNPSRSSRDRALHRAREKAFCRAGPASLQNTTHWIRTKLSMGSQAT